MSLPSPGKYKLQSAARPDLYVTCVEGKIVVKNNLSGPVDEVPSSRLILMAGT